MYLKQLALLAILLLVSCAPIETEMADEESQQILFLSSRSHSQERPGNSANWDIYWLDLESQETRRLTEIGWVTPPLALSPDGRYVAFASWAGGNKELYVLEIQTARLERLTENDVNDENPSWSPSGDLIAFVSEVGGQKDILIYDWECGEISNLTEDPADENWPNWAPESDLIAFTSTRDGSSQVYVMNSNGENVIRISENGGQEPTWSHDGRKLMYFESEYARDGTIWVGNDIFIYDFDLEYAYQLTFFGGWQMRASWSPDDKTILFDTKLIYAQKLFLIEVESRDDRRFIPFELAAYPTPESETLQEFGSKAHISEWGAAWASDGERVMFVLSGRNDHLFLLDQSENRLVQLTFGDEDGVYPVWLP